MGEANPGSTYPFLQFINQPLSSEGVPWRARRPASLSSFPHCLPSGPRCWVHARAHCTALGFSFLWGKHHLSPPPPPLLQTLRKKCSPRRVPFDWALFIKSPRLPCGASSSACPTSHPCSLSTSNFFPIDFNTLCCLLLSNRKYFLKCPKSVHPIKCKGGKGLTRVLSVIYTFTLRLRCQVLGPWMLCKILGKGWNVI